MKRWSMMLVLAAGLAIAGGPGRVAAETPVAAPEIDAGSGLSALTLLSGALVVFRSRRKR
jgi:hypothetical protein